MSLQNFVLGCLAFSSGKISIFGSYLDKTEITIETSVPSGKKSGIQGKNCYQRYGTMLTSNICHLI
jgi:hypothetical protein